MRQTFFKPLAVLLAASLLLSNCASIVSKSAYPVSIDTSPEGVQVSITDKRGKEIYRGKSPTVVRLKSGAGYFSRAEYQVRLSLKGYDEAVIPVTFKLNGWYFGNLIFGSFLGLLVVDPATGAMWRIDRESKDIYHRLSPSTTQLHEPALQIIDVNSVPPDVKSKLVRIK